MAASVSVCPFCDKTARCDSINRHVATKHPEGVMTSEMLVIEKTRIVVRKLLVRDRVIYPYGYCYKCCHAIMNHVKKSQLAVFESHVCKDKQHRTYGEKSDRVAHVPEVRKDEGRPYSDFAQELRKHVPAFKAVWKTPIEEWRSTNKSDPEVPFTDEDNRVQIFRKLNAMVPVVQEVVKDGLEAELMADEAFATAYAPDEPDYDDDAEPPMSLGQQILKDFHKNQNELTKKNKLIDAYKAKLSEKTDEIDQLKAQLLAASECNALLLKRLEDPRFAEPTLVAESPEQCALSSADVAAQA